MTETQSSQARDDQRPSGLLKRLEGGGIRGERQLTLDMRNPGEHCGRHRAARLLNGEGHLNRADLRQLKMRNQR